MPGQVTIDGLAEFRSALRQALNESPRALTKGIREAGKPVIGRVQSHVPHRSGRLGRSYAIRAAGTTGKVVSSVDYGAGAEWGMQGKWSGFAVKYGPPGRFAWRATVELQDVIADVITQQLRDVIELYGWATP